MMQDAVLRVFLVALGLIVCPRDDPGVEDWNQLVVTRVKQHEETPQRKQEEPRRRDAPVGEENALGKERRDDARETLQERDDSDGDGSTGTTDRAEQKGRFAADSTGSSDNETEENAEDVRTDGAVREDGEKSDGSWMFVFSPSSEAADKTEEEIDFLRYVCNIFSVLSAIRFLWRFLGRSRRHGDAAAAPSTVAEVRLPDVDTLRRFHARRVQAASRRKWEADFLEGFVSELLDAVREVCQQDGGVVIQDFDVVDRREIVVPLRLPAPFGFECRVSSRTPLCGQVKVVETRRIQNGCACQSADADADTVCLLHQEQAKTERADARDGPLCAKGTALLSRSQVGRWFQGAVRRAWARISHKFQFELNVRYLDAPGALAVRFRSGRTLRFTVSPAVKHDGVHFLATPSSWDDSDTSWTVSLAACEDRLLERLAKRLPDDSCHLQVLETVLFLHGRQGAMSGDAGALRGRHFRAALTHLLLKADASRWGPGAAAARLRDLLAFVEAGLRERQLRHVLVGNPSAGGAGLPAGFGRAAPVNLFHPLVAHDGLYRNALAHFQEMLRNAHALIHDYAAPEPTAGSGLNNHRW